MRTIQSETTRHLNHLLLYLIFIFFTIMKTITALTWEVNSTSSWSYSKLSSLKLFSKLTLDLEVVLHDERGLRSPSGFFFTKVILEQTLTTKSVENFSQQSSEIQKMSFCQIFLISEQSMLLILRSIIRTAYWNKSCRLF